MNRKWKILLFIGLICLVSGGVFASIKLNERGIVDVQTGKVARQDLTAIVTASGEIKPKNYINLGANAMGPLTEIDVKEGDRVKRGQVVAKIESIQAGADVVAQKAAINTSLADSAAAEAGMKAMEDAVQTAEAGLQRAKAELQRTKINLDRAQQLAKEKLIAQQDLDQRKAEYDSALASISEAETRIAQAKAQQVQSRENVTSAQRRVGQMQANLTRFSDIFDKHLVVSPIDGVVTNLPVRTGETVVQGIQNSAASTIMTIADMSLITAEVKVDETDIVNVKLDQVADITIDAIPNRIFKGHVIEIGNTAILRSTGLAASQSAVSSQEAKDFKVVIALDNPPDEIRPGLSCTSKIVTATRQKALTIPIQALTIRQRGDLEPPSKRGVQAAAKVDPAAEKAKKEELQGVFVVKNGKAEFEKVGTGITGATDIEVLNGLNEGDQIVTGSYKVIRTLRNDARVKVDNRAPVKSES
ncbi:MAG: efflux RND transporter periplasmic adaptor subunit [Bryobacteraceae bacterium]